MDRTAASYQSKEGLEAQEKPRCRSCGGETVQVLVAYGFNKPQLEWECMMCGKSFKVDGRINYKDKKKKQRYNTYKPSRPRKPQPRRK